MKRLALIVVVVVVILLLLLLLWHHHRPGAGESTACSTPCTPAGECTLIMPLPYVAEQAVLAATDSLLVGNGAAVTGINGARGVLANLGSVATAIGDQAKVGGIVSKAS